MFRFPVEGAGGILQEEEGLLPCLGQMGPNCGCEDIQWSLPQPRVTRVLRPLCGLDVVITFTRPPRHGNQSSQHSPPYSLQRTPALLAPGLCTWRQEAECQLSHTLSAGRPLAFATPADQLQPGQGGRLLCYSVGRPRSSPEMSGPLPRLSLRGR